MTAENPAIAEDINRAEWLEAVVSDLADPIVPRWNFDYRVLVHHLRAVFASDPEDVARAETYLAAACAVGEHQEIWQ